MALMEQGVTPFQRHVYQVVSQIPKGRVMTYQGLARAVGCRSYQAVGQALKRNPFAPAVPCHRVIKSDYTIGGFAGAREGELVLKKLALLAEEGVLFENGRLKDLEQVLDLPPLHGDKRKVDWSPTHLGDQLPQPVVVITVLEGAEDARPTYPLLDGGFPNGEGHPQAYLI